MFKMLFIGNIGKSIDNFCSAAMEAAKELGYEFHIVANFSDYRKFPEHILRDENRYGIRIHLADFIRMPYDIRNVKAYRQVVEIIRKEKIDMIHCNTPIGGLIGRLAGKNCKVKTIIYMAHGFHFYQGAPLHNWMIYYPIEKWLAKYTDVLITINKEDYALAKRRMTLRKNGEVKYVPGVGIKLPNHKNNSENLLNSIKQTKESRMLVRKKLKIKEDDFVYVSVGELSKRKNNKVIIEAMHEMNSRHIHYLILGQGSEGKKLRRLVNQYQLSPYVHFMGFQNNVDQFLSASDVFVLSSLQEGLARSLMEAMAAGLPCLVSDIRGNRDLIQNDDYRCDVSSVEDWEKKMRIICGMDKDNVKKIGYENNRFVINFSFEKVVDSYKKLYSDFRQC